MAVIIILPQTTYLQSGIWLNDNPDLQRSSTDRV